MTYLQTLPLAGLKESLGRLVELQRAQFMELEELQIRHAQEWDDLANGGDVMDCETCGKIFARNTGEIKNYQYECQNCRPTVQPEPEFDQLLEDHEEYNRELARQIF